MTITRVSLPDAPPVTKRTSTLLDVATVNDGLAWMDGLEPLWDSYDQMEFRTSVAHCDTNPDKTFDQHPSWVSGFLFAVYGGVSCKTVGLDRDRMRTEVQRVFDLGESFGVEQALMGTRFADDTLLDDDSNPLRWTAAEDITPAGGAVDGRVGMALLEAGMSCVYTGLPTLHMPVSIGSLLAGRQAIKQDGGIFRSMLGSPVAIGAGYECANIGPDGDAPDAGEKWLYASGGVVLQRGSMNLRQGIEFADNDVIVLAERDYVAAVDGPVLAIRVKVE